MRVRGWCVLAGLLAASSASAVPVRLVIESGRPGVAHDASAACERVAGAEVCTEGEDARGVTGELVGDRLGGRMVGVRGVLRIEGGERVRVRKGTIDLHGGPDGVVAQLFTRGHGVFTFLDHAFPSGGSELRDGWLFLNGTNGASGDEALGLQLAVRLRADLRRGAAVPEPGLAALAVALCALASCRLTRRARRA